MPVRPIVKFPDPRLLRAADPVVTFDDALRVLAVDLLDTMRAAPGIGITAPHLGVMRRLVVIALAPQDGIRTYVNPRIIWSSDETTSYEEGSVSMPGVSEAVTRPAEVRVAYQDLTGAPQTDAASGLLAICLQHEIDQLDGIFWIARLSRLKRDRLVKRYDKLQRAMQR